jgi:hypothetical protein
MMQSFNKDLMMHLPLFLGPWRRVQFLLYCSLMLISCGKGFNSDKPQLEELEPGRFHVNLRPLNSKLGRYIGWVSITISDNQFWVRAKVVGPKTGSMHAQYLHANAVCPSMKDDTNGDGYLDFTEAYAVSGPILIPLDSNLNSQMKGLNIFPKMRQSSFYYYSEACNTSVMMEDLRQRDTYSADMMIKLKNGEELALKRRVVMVYGTSEYRPLPSTVNSFEGYPSQASIPIACGIIEEGESDGFNP